jgi:hypothetical protein
VHHEPRRECVRSHVPEHPRVAEAVGVEVILTRYRDG